MAITATNIIYPNSVLTADDFAFLMEYFFTKSTGILKGCEISKKGNDGITISQGYIEAYGRIIKVENGDWTFELPKSGDLVTGRLYLSLDLATNQIALGYAEHMPKDTISEDRTSGIVYVYLATVSLLSTGIFGDMPTAKTLPSSNELQKVYTGSKETNSSILPPSGVNDRYSFSVNKAVKEGSYLLFATVELSGGPTTNMKSNDEIILRSKKKNESSLKTLRTYAYSFTSPEKNTVTIVDYFPTLLDSGILSESTHNIGDLVELFIGGRSDTVNRSATVTTCFLLRIA